MTRISGLTNEETKLKALLVDVAKFCDDSTSRKHDQDLILRFTGGWVRDKLLDIPCNDVDVGINSMKGFQFASYLIEFLKRHGSQYDVSQSSVHRIFSNPEKSKHLETACTRLYGIDVDFVNLRSEEYSQESRIPIMEDALRRDATLNALFYNLHTGAVEDFTERGLSDLSAGILRTPLEPFQTFNDDPLRILRLIRFASRFGFSIAEDALQSMKDERIKVALRTKISRERIGIEVDKMLKSPRPDVALLLIDSLGLYDCIFFNPDHTPQSPVSLPLGKCTRATMSLLSELSTGQLHEYLRKWTPPQKKQLWLFAAVLPWGSQMYTLKKMQVPYATIAAREALKRPREDCDIISRAVESELSTADIVRIKDPKRSQIGMHIRGLGPSWKLLIAMSLLRELVSSQENHQFSTPQSQSVRKLYSRFCEKIESENLQYADTIRPIINGKELTELLHLAKGPAIQAALDKLIAWQMDHPESGKNDCIGYLEEIYGPLAKKIKLNSAHIKQIPAPSSFNDIRRQNVFHDDVHDDARQRTNEYGYTLSSTAPEIIPHSEEEFRLKNKNTIQGTSVVLETPEDIARWIEERKKKWPTDKRVQEKKEDQKGKQQAGLRANQHARGRSSKVCKYFSNTGKCTKGKRCPFEHVKSSRPLEMSNRIRSKSLFAKVDYKDAHLLNIQLVTTDIREQNAEVLTKIMEFADAGRIPL